jgi:hypothetical protein
MVSIAEPSAVSINEPLNLLTMKKIIKTKVSNASIASNVSITSRQFSVIRHWSFLFILHLLHLFHLLGIF